MQEKKENNTKTIHRLSEYITKSGTTFNKLALELGLSNSYFSKMIKNNGSIGSDIIENILRIYPDLNANWLLSGHGSMLCNNESTREIISSSSDSTLLYKIYEENKELHEVNANLREEVGSLKAQVKSQEHTNTDSFLEKSSEPSVSISSKQKGSVADSAIVRSKS